MNYNQAIDQFFEIAYSIEKNMVYLILRGIICYRVLTRNKWGSNIHRLICTNIHPCSLNC